MPLFSSKLQLTNAASSSGVALSDIQFTRGAFYSVESYTQLVDIPVDRITNDQIVWVESSSATYQATYFTADYISVFADSASWGVFTGFGGGSSTLSGLSDVSGSVTDGQVLQYDSASGNWVPNTLSGAGGDITAVFTSDEGITGGATSGNVVLELDPGDGISVSSTGINLNTGSTHFVNAVQALSDTSIFTLTGSDYATTNNIQITGSLTLQLDTAGDTLAIYSGSDKKFSITNEGILRLVTQSGTPTAVEGGMYLDSNYDLYIGQD